MANAKDAQASDVDLWFPLFIGDYLSDTMHLTTEEHGAYLLLIMSYWKNQGPLPDKPNSLRAITRLHGDAWSNAQAVLKEFFSIENGVWRHSRIDEEIKKARLQKTKKVEKAKKAAAARWKNHEKCPSDAQAYPQALPKDMLDECPSPSPSPIDRASPVGDALSAHQHQKEESFAMYKNWCPSDDFDEKCALSGISLHDADQGKVSVLLGEFKNYWMTNPGRQKRHTQWEHALLQQVIRAHTSGGLYEHNNGTNKGPGVIDWSDTSWITELPEGDGQTRQ